MRLLVKQPYKMAFLRGSPRPNRNAIFVFSVFSQEFIGMNDLSNAFFLSPI